MFKIVKSATYSAMQEEISEKKAVIEALKEDLNRSLDRRKQLVQERDKLSNDYHQAKAANEACKAMREDQRIAIHKLKTDLAKQGDELVTKTDEVKQLKRSLDVCQKKQVEMEAQLETKSRLANEYNELNAAMNLAVNAAITEMRKTRKGRTSQNNVRAFEILKAAIGQK